MSDFLFTYRLKRKEGIYDLTFTCVTVAPLPGGCEQAEAVYASPYRTSDGKSTLYVYRQGRCDVLCFPRIADFYLWPERIVCQLLNPAYEFLAEIWLLGTVLSLWLERQNILSLHASAVVIGDSAVAFLANTGGGKSALAGMLMQVGYRLLSDDVLPIEPCRSAFVGRPGYPQMRMWPDEVQYFLGHYEDLKLVHPAYSKRRVPVGFDGFGTFCDEARPLTCIYLPERRDPVDWGTKVEITAVSRRDAVAELMRHSFSAGIVEALGLGAQRLNLFAQMVQHVPIRRIIYPNGLDHLPEVRNTILADLKIL